MFWNSKQQTANANLLKIKTDCLIGNLSKTDDWNLQMLTDFQPTHNKCEITQKSIVDLERRSKWKELCLKGRTEPQPNCLFETNIQRMILLVFWDKVKKIYTYPKHITYFKEFPVRYSLANNQIYFKNCWKSFFKYRLCVCCYNMEWNISLPFFIMIPSQ